MFNRAPSGKAARPREARKLSHARLPTARPSPAQVPALSLPWPFPTPLSMLGHTPHLVSTRFSERQNQEDVQFCAHVRAHIQMVHMGLCKEWALVIVGEQVQNLQAGQAARRLKKESQVSVCRQNSLCLGDPSFFLLSRSTDWTRPTYVREGGLLHSESTDITGTLI